VLLTAVVPTHRCGAVPDSHRVPSCLASTVADGGEPSASATLGEPAALSEAHVMDAATLVREALADADSGWSIGAPGAIAEFVRTPDELADVTAASAVTARGGVRVTLPPDVTAVAYETPVGPGDHWNHAVAFCVPADGHGHEGLTELGTDDDALRPDDRDAVLFDLGLGLAGIDACVRTADPELLAVLRDHTGCPLFTPGSPLVARLVAATPHRVFRTACGRIEVYAAIPPPEGRSPDGPHTHLLPAALQHRRTHAATVPVPDGLVPVAHLYPPHPLRETTGEPIPFDPARQAAFDRLLAAFGDARQQAVAEAVRAAVQAGRGPDAAPEVTRAPERAALAVALRKLAHAGAPDALLTRWRHRAPHAPLDHDGDRNA
jgi:hypothetical protein